MGRSTKSQQARQLVVRDAFWRVADNALNVTDPAVRELLDHIATELAREFLNTFKATSDAEV
jgi:hypothetical protein